MLRHLCLERPLDQHLRELLEQAILANQILRLRISAMVISRFGERDQSGRWCCAVSGL
jgi:hypothetical protein